MKIITNSLFKILITVILSLLILIGIKASTTFKNKFYRKVYEENISFAKIKKLYYKYLGGINPIDKFVEKEISVFNEKLTYDDESIYHDGVKLNVGNNYLVPVIKEGMVIFIGEKENYGNVIIIDDVDGINTWYGNMDKTTVKLYDYVSSGTYLGTTKDNYLYLVYESNGKFLNYKDYLP